MRNVARAVFGGWFAGCNVEGVVLNVWQRKYSVKGVVLWM